MRTNKDVIRYSSVSKCFHWAIALIVVVLLIVGFLMGELKESIQPTVYTIHKSFGLTVLALMILRLLWITHAGRPPLPVSVPRWEVILSRVVQYSLYFVLIIMPLSGWIMSTAAKHIPVYFGLIEIPFPGIQPNKPLAEFFNQIHITLAWVIIGLVLLHIAGALKHHFIDKDDVLKSMW
jgi:cytochrome b561